MLTQDYKNSSIIPFQYQVSISLGNSASGSTSLTLATDSWFELHCYRASSSLDADTDFMPGNFTVQITDQSTGRQLQNAEINQRAISPMYGLPIKRPVMFPPNATLSFNFTNTVASANVVAFVLDGFKIFNFE